MNAAVTVDRSDRVSVPRSNLKFWTTGAIIALTAIGAYGVGRVYPPQGPMAGTITPADRYVSAQVGAKDVQLGDQSVAQLMQTDAFDLLTRDPTFRALARDPGFQAALQNSQAMAVIAANPKVFAQLAADPAAFAAAVRNANALSAAAMQADASRAAAIASMTQDAQAFSALSEHPQVFSAIALNADAFADFSRAAGIQAALRNPQAIAAVRGNAAAFARLAADAQAMARLSQGRAIDAMAQNAEAFAAMGANPQALALAANQASLLSAQISHQLKQIRWWRLRSQHFANTSCKRSVPCSGNARAYEVRMYSRPFCFTNWRKSNRISFVAMTSSRTTRSMDLDGSWCYVGAPTLLWTILSLKLSIMDSKRRARPSVTRTTRRRWNCVSPHCQNNSLTADSSDVPLNWRTKRPPLECWKRLLQRQRQYAAHGASATSPACSSCR